MSKNKYLNVPEDITEQIDEMLDAGSITGYRCLYHLGDPTNEDFLPTFVDDNQKRIREVRRRCGPMADVVVSEHKETNPSEYSVSLYSTIESLKKCLWKNDSYKKDYPAIAVGDTSKSKGKTVKDSKKHISYYLFDYVGNNPHCDFATIEEAKFDE